MIYYTLQFWDYDIRLSSSRPQPTQPAPAIQEPEIALVGNEPTYFYTSYTASGKPRATVRGSKAMCEEYRALSIRDGYKVSAIIPNLPLSPNLMFHYSWEGGQQTQTLRKEYQPAEVRKAA